mmetsp:Transcript_133509/g.259959  ORF Transcript_133509/g.259959 Transcript_133509/m.259959 type:complete len:233 (+) Transcript_133509:833-1531(+)
MDPVQSTTKHTFIRSACSYTLSTESISACLRCTFVFSTACLASASVPCAVVPSFTSAAVGGLTFVHEAGTNSHRRHDLIPSGKRTMTVSLSKSDRTTSPTPSLPFHCTCMPTSKACTCASRSQRRTCAPHCRHSSRARSQQPVCCSKSPLLPIQLQPAAEYGQRTCNWLRLAMTAGAAGGVSVKGHLSKGHTDLCGLTCRPEVQVRHSMCLAGHPSCTGSKSQAKHTGHLRF